MKKTAKIDHEMARALCDGGYMTTDAYVKFCKDYPAGGTVNTTTDSGGGGHGNPPPPGDGG